MRDHVLALDQGTTSSRAIVFDRAGRPVAVAQKEFEQHYPRPGWVEHDPVEIWDNTRAVIGLALGKANATGADLAAIGITNQRETTVVWDRATGEPVHHAIVWQDTRTSDLVAQLGGEHAVGRNAAVARKHERHGGLAEGHHLQHSRPGGARWGRLPGVRLGGWQSVGHLRLE